MNFTYPKSERLCSKILIEKLFESGYKIYTSLYKILWLPVELEEKVAVQSLISISKRRFRRANKRNLLKRRIKEAFRKNKNPFYQSLDQCGNQIIMVIIYNSNQISDYIELESDLIKVFELIQSKISKLPDIHQKVL
jgi:ribonuclease P protein component